MYSDWLINLIVVAATLLAVALSVLTHYEGLVLASRGLGRLGGQQRVKVLYGIGSVLCLHVVEIWIFGAILWVLLHWPAFGGLGPAGAIRFLSGTEALTGFVLITWSASFTYLEMERVWRVR